MLVDKQSGRVSCVAQRAPSGTSVEHGSNLQTTGKTLGLNYASDAAN